MSSLLTAGRKRHYRRHRLGRGVISELLGSVGLGKKHHRRRHFGGELGDGRRRRRVHRRRHVTLSGLLGDGRRRRRHYAFGRRHRRRGRGFMDVLKTIGNTVLDVGKFAAPILASGALGSIGSALGKRVIGGRRRRYRTHRIGGLRPFHHFGRQIIRV